MSSRDGCERSAFGGLALGIAIMAVVAATGAGVNWLSALHHDREAIEQIARCDSAKPDDCAQKDLVANVRAASANEDAVDASIWQIGLNIVALAGVALTVFYAHHAWRQAMRSANAADKALRHGTETSERQLRPYVFVDIVRWYWLWDEQDTEKPEDERRITHWRFHVVWKNVGQTPASKVRARMNGLVVESRDLGLDFTFPDRDYLTDNVGAAGPGQTFESNFVIDVPTLQAVYAGEERLALWAWVEYSGLDATIRHRTEWHAWVAPYDQLSTHRDSGFQFNIGDRHNGYDDSCHRRPSQ